MEVLAVIGILFLFAVFVTGVTTIVRFVLGNHTPWDDERAVEDIPKGSLVHFDSGYKVWK